jgi:hypothetical protein
MTYSNRMRSPTIKTEKEAKVQKRAVEALEMLAPRVEAG